MISRLINILERNTVVNEDEKEICYYALFVILFNLFLISSIFVVGIIINKFVFSVYFLLFFIPIRILLGGFHCKTVKKCYFSFMSIVIITFLFDEMINLKYYEYLNILSLLLIIYSYLNLVFAEGKIRKCCIILFFILIIYAIIFIYYPFLQKYIMYSFLLNSLFYISNNILNILNSFKEKI